jgi:uncharacterized protein
MPIVVSRLTVTPVKGTRVHRVEEIELVADGARGNRRFFIADQRNRMVNGKMLGELHSVVASCDNGKLRLAFPDGKIVEDEIELGDERTVLFFRYPRQARPLHGPWNEALSEHVGRAVNLFDGGAATDRGERGTVSLISRGSLARLAERAGESDIDSRRFRMLVEIDGVAPHEEDRWAGREVRIGAAAVRFNGHVGRCMVTSRDPDNGRVNFPTLDILGDYRRGLPTTEPLPFGIYGEVLSPGPVRVGDPVKPVQ